MQRKIQKVFIDYGFGFPVKLTNVPMVKVRGIWTPEINYHILDNVILRLLAFKTSPLTGDELRYIRHHFAMNLSAFAERFYVSHPAVLKWEKMQSKPTKMNWSTEKDIRLFVLTRMKAKPKEIAELYLALEGSPVEKRISFKVDITAHAA